MFCKQIRLANVFLAVSFLVISVVPINAQKSVKQKIGDDVRIERSLDGGYLPSWTRGLVAFTLKRLVKPSHREQAAMAVWVRGRSLTVAESAAWKKFRKRAFSRSCVVAAVVAILAVGAKKLKGSNVNVRLFSCHNHSRVFGNSSNCGNMVMFGPFSWISTSGSGEVIEGSGIHLRDEREIGDVDGVDIAGVGILILKQADVESLSVEGDDNIVPRIVTDVDGTTLLIHPENGVSITPRQKLIYRLSLKEIKKIKLSNSVKMKSNGVVRGDTLDLACSNASQVEATLEVDALEITASNKGSIQLRGDAKKQNVHLSNAAVYGAENLQSERITVTASNKSKATLAVSKSLRANAKNASSVFYRGNPATVSKNASNASSVRKIG
jgi:hypothetical protein